MTRKNTSRKNKCIQMFLPTLHNFTQSSLTSHIHHLAAGVDKTWGKPWHGHPLLPGVFFLSVIFEGQLAAHQAGRMALNRRHRRGQSQWNMHCSVSRYLIIFIPRQAFLPSIGRTLSLSSRLQSRRHLKSPRQTLKQTLPRIGIDVPTI